jgi:hypothetical protein
VCVLRAKSLLVFVSCVSALSMREIDDFLLSYFLEVANISTYACVVVFDNI